MRGDRVPRMSVVERGKVIGPWCGSEAIGDFLDKFLSWGFV
jgi:hypothetical protein